LALLGLLCDGAFGEVQVHVLPFHKFLKIFELGLHVLDVICEQCWIICVCCRDACVMGGVVVEAQRLGFQPSHEWFEKEYEDVQVEGVLLYGSSTNVYGGGRGLVLK
jgi:hypothetical protein